MSGRYISRLTLLKETFTYALCIYISIACAVYGICKVFDIQFAYVQNYNEKKVGELTGMQLTWVFFGYSRPYQIIIGILQVLGSALLLIPRTRIFGCLVLLPILLNIVLIDFFYGVYHGAFVNAVFYTLGLVYILITQKEKLQEAIRFLLMRKNINKTENKLLRVLYVIIFLAVLALLNNMFY